MNENKIPKWHGVKLDTAVIIDLGRPLIIMSCMLLTNRHKLSLAQVKILVEMGIIEDNDDLFKLVICQTKIQNKFNPNTCEYQLVDIQHKIITNDNIKPSEVKRQNVYKLTKKHYAEEMAKLDYFDVLVYIENADKNPWDTVKSRLTPVERDIIPHHYKIALEQNLQITEWVQNLTENTQL